MTEADLARKWPELDEQARHAAIAASSTVGMYGTEAERTLLQDVMTAMDKARRDKDAAELERQMRLAQRLSNAAFNRHPRAWEWYFEDAASEVSKCRDCRAPSAWSPRARPRSIAPTTPSSARGQGAVAAAPESSDARKKGFDSAYDEPAHREPRDRHAGRQPVLRARPEHGGEPDRGRRESQKLLGMLELGFAEVQRYATPLGPQPRTAELVRAAVAALRDPYQRLVAELWARHGAARHRRAARARGRPSRRRDGLRRALGWRP